TLSPTPPLECLSITGPGSDRLFHSSIVPDLASPTVIATRSPIVMPRKNTAMANAATWPSLRPPSLIPRTTKPISSPESSLPSRFLRMISCGSMDLAVVLQKLAQHSSHFTRRRAGDGNRLIVAECARHQTGGVVGHQRQGDHFHAGLPGEDGFGRGRHADRIGAQDAGGADLGRRLEARAAEPDVNTFV